jgi:hypothetical protein
MNPHRTCFYISSHFYSRPSVLHITSASIFKYAALNLFFFYQKAVIFLRDI